MYTFFQLAHMQVFLLFKYSLGLCAQNPSSQDALSSSDHSSLYPKASPKTGCIFKELNIHSPKHTPKRLPRLAQKMRSYPIYYSNPVLMVKECLGNLPVNLIPEDEA